MEEWLARIEEPDTPSRTVVIRAGDVLGRHPDNSIVLSDPSVSKRHARIVESATGLAIQDLGSENRVHFANGRALARDEVGDLRPGVSVLLGKTWLVIERKDSSQRSSALVGASTSPATERRAQDVDDVATARRPELDASTVARMPLDPDRSEQVTVRARSVATGSVDAPSAADENVTVARAVSASPAPAPPAPAPPAPAPPAPAPPAPAPPAPAPPASAAPPVPAAPPAPASGDKPAARSAGARSAARDSGAPSGQTSFRSGILQTLRTKWLSGGRDQWEGVAIEAFISTAAPRFVVDSVIAREVVQISSKEFVIGRSSQSSYRIDHAAVSGQHARISLDDGRVFIEDLDSKNHVFVEGERISSRRELRSDTCFRIGSLAALFVVDQDASGNETPRQVYDRAFDFLWEEVVRKERRKDAAPMRKSKHPGEQLVLAEIVTADQWAEAVRRARNVYDIEGGRKVAPGRRRALLVGLVLVALVVAVLLTVL